MRNLITNPVQTLFLGTDWESVSTLKSLLQDKRFNIVGVITTIDKPIGRKQILTPSKVKEFAIKYNIEVFHTEKQEKKYHEALEKFKPELIVCKAFGEILPDFFIQYPKYKSINIHFSLLPKYRGAVPIQKAILDGEKETGITIMLMSAGMDEGDILSIFKEPILKDDTNLSLRERLVKKASQVLGNVLENWIQGNIQPVKQDESKATYCWQRDISKESAEIKWEDMEPEYIERMVRAMIPWPIAWSKLNRNDQKEIKEKKIQILQSELSNTTTDLIPGTLFVKDSTVLISTKNSNKAVRVIRFRLEGKKDTSEKEFLNGIGRNIV